MPDETADFRRLIEPVLSTVSLELSPGQMEGLSAHYALLRKWNRRINLTSIRDPRRIVERHFGESLFVAKHLDDRVGSLVDVGSGGGFPGIPIAAVHPQRRVTLVESNGKKAAFLKEVVRGWGSVAVFHGRVEDLEGPFDCCTVRAVSLGSLFPQVLGLASRFAVLAGGAKDQQPPKLQGLDWEPAVPLPWGKSRVLLLGRATRDRRCAT